MATAAVTSDHEIEEAGEQNYQSPSPQNINCPHSIPEIRSFRLGGSRHRQQLRLCDVFGVRASAPISSEFVGDSHAHPFSTYQSRC